VWNRAKILILPLMSLVSLFVMAAGTQPPETMSALEKFVDGQVHILRQTSDFETRKTKLVALSQQLDRWYEPAMKVLPELKGKAQRLKATDVEVEKGNTFQRIIAVRSSLMPVNQAFASEGEMARGPSEESCVKLISVIRRENTGFAREGKKLSEVYPASVALAITEAMGCPVGEIN
jgi:hypothetical protein